MTSNERQTKLRTARAAAGVVPLTVWVRKEQRAEFKRLVEMMMADGNLTVVSVALQNAKNGRMQGVKLR